MTDTDLERQAPGGTNRGMGSHELPNVGATNVWLTPPHVIKCLGEFDLDPCAAPLPAPWRTAKREIRLPDDGLEAEWFGRVWLNPPYGAEAYTWLDKLAAHGDGIGLTFARTETVGFMRAVWGKADAILFLSGRLTFHRPDGTPGVGNSGAPSCLIAYGESNVCALDTCGLAGALAYNWKRP